MFVTNSAKAALMPFLGGRLYDGEMRIRLRFSLRTLLAAVGVISVLLGFAIPRWKGIKARHRAVERIIHGERGAYAIRFDGENVPWDLWICGERRSILYIDLNLLRKVDENAPEAIRTLFPEVTIKSSSGPYTSD